MSETTTPVAATPVTSTCAIRSRDFHAAKEHRVSWTGGALRHVVDALAGAPVAITIDSQTGHTVVGAVLLGLRNSMYGGSYELLVRYPDGHVTAHLVFNLGEVIIPLGITGGDEYAQSAKWTALDTYRKESGAAISRAQKEHGEGRTSAGRWVSRAELDQVSVTYEPSERLPYSERRELRGHWTYRIADLKS
jgi:hypothetical protein